MPTRGEIVTSLRTGNDVDDAGRGSAPLGQIVGEIASVTADGAYDSVPTYQAIARRQPEQPPLVMIPPRSSAVLGDQADRPPTQRDRHIRHIHDQGRMA